MGLQKYWKVAEWLNAFDCKSNLFGVRGFESLPSNKKNLGKKTFLIYNNIIKNKNKMKTLNITIAIIGGGAGAGVNDCVMSKSF